MTQQTFKIDVPSEDPKKEESLEPKHKDEKDSTMELGDIPSDELSEEDKKLKDDLQMAVSRITSLEEQNGVHKLALELLRSEIRTATSSMTSVPKPLKFLRPFYGDLKSACEKYKDETNRKDLADIISVLGMTMGKEGDRETLKYKLMGNLTDLGSWGHEFVRSLAGEIGQEYAERSTKVEDGKSGDVSDLMLLVDEIVPFHMKHNAEPEAVDLLLEVQHVEKLLDSPDIDVNNYQRICLYLLSCADFMPDEDDLGTLLNTAYQLYKRLKQYPDAARVAIKMGKLEYLGEIFRECDDESTKKQLGYIAGRQRVNFVYEEDETINELISNGTLSELFLSLARDLDVVEAKTPEDIYKSHLSETAGVSSSSHRTRDSGPAVDSARQNLASTFVNAFVNAGYNSDKLMTLEGSPWLYKNKEHGMLSAAASLGMLMLWNVEEGLTQIDKFLYSGEDYIRAGAILAVGIVSAGVRNDCDPALALLSEHIVGEEKKGPGEGLMKSCACLGLGLAYAGSAREDVAEILTPVVACTGADVNFTDVAYAALSLGMIYIGTCNEDVGSVLIQRLMESSDLELDHSMARFLCLGLGLLFLGSQDTSEAMLEAVKTVEHKRGKYAAITLETCAFAGTGNVLKVQEMLHVCAEHLQENAEHQSVAVLGIALVTMGEGIGSEMAVRTFDHLLQYGELPVRRAVPLALALLNISNPDYSLVDTLSRLTHDADAELAQAAIFALGLISAGTNNSRVAGLLRQLSEFYSREANHLFIVRIAQGLLHMGKGLITLHPFHSDRLLKLDVGIGGLLTVFHAALDMKNTILDKAHYLLYLIATAMNARMVITLDEDLNPLPVSIRVGQAVEVVGQAGRPKSITGFQTHTTPVLLNVKDRAELATEEYLSCTNVLEGVVILKKNPDYNPAA